MRWEGFIKVFCSISRLNRDGKWPTELRQDRSGIGLVADGLLDLGLKFFAKLRIVGQQLFRCVASLGEFTALVAVPASALLDDIVFGAEVYNLTNFGDALTEHDFKISIAETR